MDSPQLLVASVTEADVGATIVDSLDTAVVYLLTDECSEWDGRLKAGWPTGTVLYALGVTPAEEKEFIESMNCDSVVLWRAGWPYAGIAVSLCGDSVAWPGSD